MKASIYTGFSKLNREQRQNYLLKQTPLTESSALTLNDFDAPDELQQQTLAEMSENYIGNFPLPMGLVTNMVINDESFVVPFVTEESSVIAAASKSTTFWANRGGFRASVQGMTKKGQVHFTWCGNPDLIKAIFPSIRVKLFAETKELTRNMRLRGGGITDLQLFDKTEELLDYYQLDVSFETGDAMGANFINSCLEKIASSIQTISELNTSTSKVEIIMSILSNYTPDCLVKCWVECPVEMLEGWNNALSYNTFATKFKQSVDIANFDISRAVTHNKGIFNGIDAVLIATGNDWRATSAAAHAYASRSGRYKGLTTIQLKEGIFRYELELPLAIGTAGGITAIHPVVKKAQAILDFPDAAKLMMIVAASGLASNFSAIASLISTGIQAGHMKLHLSNVLNQIDASTSEKKCAYVYFNERTVSYSLVSDYIQQIRRINE